MALRSAVEETIALRYMLRCLGVPVRKPTLVFGDNLGSIQSATIPEADLKKKHVAISYHFVREAVAASIIKPIWIKSHENFADVLTKSLGRVLYESHVHDLMA